MSSAGRVMSGLELLAALAVCCTEKRMQVSQVAVLATIGLHPGCSSGTIARVTGISLAHVCKLLHDLEVIGDVQHTKARGRDYRTLKRRLFLSSSGERVLRGVLAGMGVDASGRWLVKAVHDAHNKWTF